MKIRCDERGLYITSRGGKDYPDGHYRPGRVVGYSHVFRMDDGGLKEGSNPKTYHVSGAPLIKITLDDGTVLYWATTYELDRMAAGHWPPTSAPT